MSLELDLAIPGKYRSKLCSKDDPDMCVVLRHDYPLVRIASDEH